MIRLPAYAPSRRRQQHAPANVLGNDLILYVVLHGVWVRVCVCVQAGREEEGRAPPRLLFPRGTLVPPRLLPELFATKSKLT